MSSPSITAFTAGNCFSALTAACKPTFQDKKSAEEKIYQNSAPAGSKSMLKVRFKRAPLETRTSSYATRGSAPNIFTEMLTCIGVIFLM